VFVERPGHHPARDAVLADNSGGVADAVRHLVAAGHRRIAYIGDDPAYYTAGQRRDGFLTAVAEQGLSTDAPVLMDGGASLIDGPVLHQWTTGREAVTAVVTGNNRTSRQLLYALRRHPDVDIGYVCFDEWDTADLMHPSVTTVDQNAARIGRSAAELLLSRIAGADDPPRHVVVPTRLSVRESAYRGLGRPTPLEAMPFPA